MVIDNIFRLNSRLNSATRVSEPIGPNFLTRMITAGSRQFSRLWCGMHGHLIMLHFEPNKLSLQCALCGYESEGWEVGRSVIARRTSDNGSNRIHAHVHQVRPDRERRGLRAVPSSCTARMAS
jgi:hypothetical protein